MESENGEGPGPRGSKGGDGGQSFVEERCGPRAEALAAGAADHRTECPERAPVAVFGAVFLEPFAVETHEIAETPGVADKRVLEEGGVRGAGEADFGRAFVKALEEN